MKGYALTTVLLAPFLLAAALASSCQQVKPPTCDELSETPSYHAHETICELFYRCDLGKRSIFSCPAKQRFSDALKMCEEEEKVECNRCSLLESDDILVETPKSICPETPTCGPLELGNKKPYPPDCTKYIYCDEFGNELLSFCQNGTHFSPNLLYCTNPVQAMCPLCDISTTTVTTPSVATTVGICPESRKCELGDLGLTLPYPPDCNKFWYCDESGKEILSVCPNGTHYSEDLEYCTLPEVANCPTCLVLTTTEILPTTTETITTIGICPEHQACSELDFGLTKPYPSNCSLFIYCDESGDEILSICPNNTNFSPKLKYCTSIEEAACPLCEVVTPTTLISSTTPSTTTTSTTTLIPTTTSSDISSTIGICYEHEACTLEQVGLTKPYPSNCSYYIYCDEYGNDVLSKCRNETHFSPELMYCTDPESAKCPVCEAATPTTMISSTLPFTTTITTSTTTLSTTTSSDLSSTLGICSEHEACTLEQVGLTKPYPSDCTQYIYCDEYGNDVFSKCRNGTHFSSDLLYCTDPELAKCPLCEVVTTTTVESTTTLSSTTVATTPDIQTTIGFCPPTPTCNVTDFGMLKPYPKNCSMYIYCDNFGNSILSVCSNGTHFNPTLRYCMNPDIANCPQCEVEQTTIELLTVTEEITATTEEITTNTEILTTLAICPITPTCTALDNGKNKPYPPECTQYIYCDSEGDGVISECPGGKHFSPKSLYCMEADLANCPFCEVTSETTIVSTPSIPPTTDITSTTVLICPEIKSCGVLEFGQMKPYPTDCTKYIYCTFLSYFVRVCPNGYEFSPTLNKCMLPEEAKCPVCIELNTPVPTTTPIEMTTTADISTTVGICPATPVCLVNEVGVTKEYPPDCSKYIYCDKAGDAKISVCPKDLHYNPLQDYCQEPEKANCPYCEVLTTTIASTTTEAETTIQPVTTTEVPTTTVVDSTTIAVCAETPTCLANETGQLKPVPKNCTQYIYCNAEGTGQISVCPNGEHFSPSNSYCMEPDLANCPYCEIFISSTTVIDTTVITSSTIPECPPVPTCEFELGVTKPYPSDCSKYIYCSSNTSFSIRVCPVGFHYSPQADIKRCLESDVANCPFCLVETTPDSTQTATTPLTTTTEISSITDLTEESSTVSETTTEIVSTTVGICPITPTCGQWEFGVFKPYPPDCTMFIICVGFTTSFIVPCTEGQLFSPITNTCMPEAEAKCPYCVEDGMTTSETPPTTETITKSSDATTEAFTTISIPDTTTEEVTTTDFSSTTVGLCPETESCGRFSFGQTKPYPPDCSKFIFCISINNFVLLACPAGEFFSPDNKNCTLEVEANCPTCIENVTTPEAPSTTVTITSTSETTTEALTTISIPDTTTDEITTTELISTTVGLCPETETCGRFSFGQTKPYPPDCSKFIFCISINNFVMLACPAGEFFSPDNKNCTIEAEANCPTCIEETTLGPVTTPSTTIDVSTTETTTTEFVCPPYPTCTDGVDDYFRKSIPDNCFKYLYCDPINGPEERPCPRMQHFSPMQKSCMEPSVAKCIQCSYKSTSGTTLEDVTTEEPTEFPTTLPPTTVTEAPTIVATETTEEPTEVPTIETTETTEATTPAVTDTTTEALCINHVCGLFENDFKYPYVQDCTKYIYCEFGLTKISNCINSQHFSPTTLECVDPLLAQCTECIDPTTLAPEIPTEELTETPSNPTITDTTTEVLCINHVCGLLENDFKYPYVQDCTKYIYCEFGLTKIRNCINSQHFSPTTLECVDPLLAQCTECIDPTTLAPEIPTDAPTDPPTTNPGLPPCAPNPVCGMFETGIKKPYPPECSQYILCEMASSSVRDCLPGQHFSPTAYECQASDIANCPACTPLWWT